KLWTCDPTNPNQRWTWHTNGTIENTGTNYCLDAAQKGATSQQQISLAPCNTTSPTQHFTPQTKASLAMDLLTPPLAPLPNIYNINSQFVVFSYSQDVVEIVS